MKPIQWYNIMLYRHDPALDAVLDAVMERAERYSEGEFEITAYDKDDNEIAKMWNRNFPYSWLSKGTYITKSNNEFKWGDKRPSRGKMNDLLGDRIKKLKL